MKKLLTLCAALLAAMTMSAENLTCADAAATALALGENVESTEIVSVEGYITNTNGTVSREQQTFYMDDVKGSGAKTLQAYWANLPADDKVTPLAVGDKIILTGKLLHYVSSSGVHTAEIKNGDVTVLERTVVELDTISVDACGAIEEGLALNNKEYTEDIFEVSGVVSAVSNTNDNYHSQTFDLECTTQTNKFTAYNCTVIGNYVAIGDSVIVLGKLTNFDGTIEIASGKAWVTKGSGIVVDTIEVSVAQALAIAQGLGNNVAAKDLYRVVGYIDSITTPYSNTYNNISFFMCDDLTNPQFQFVAYKVNGGAELKLGDKVMVTGNICHYYKAGTDSVPDEHVYELSAGADVELLEPATPELAFYIAGNDSSLFGSEWAPNSCKMEKQQDGTYTKVFNNCVPEQEYQFKITTGSWEQDWGCNNVTNNSYSVYCSSPDNITLRPASTYLKVIFDPTTEQITIEGELLEIPHHQVILRGMNLYGCYQYKEEWGIDTYWFDDRTEVVISIENGLSIRVTEGGSCGNWLGWSDGNMEMYDRVITITSDTVIESLFDAKSYEVSITAGWGGYLDNGNIEGKIYECNNYICRGAYPRDGYYFVEWSNGVTDTELCMGIYSDTVVWARFAEIVPATVIAAPTAACASMGTVTGGGAYNTGDNVTITAVPNEGYHFVEWSDGNGRPERTFRLISDTTLYATFAAGDMGGKCGKNLFWEYADSLLTITGTGEMDIDSYYTWKDAKVGINKVSLPEGLTYLSGYEFFGKNIHIKELTIPASVVKMDGFEVYYYTELERLEYLGNSMKTTSDHVYTAARYIKMPGEYFNVWDIMVDSEEPWKKLDTIVVTNGEMYVSPNEYYDYYYDLGFVNTPRYIDLTNASNTTLENLHYIFTKQLRTLYLPSQLEVVSEEALKGCQYLSSVVIPAKVVEIEADAFEDCRSMTSVTFAGNKVKTIGDWAFYNCHNLRNLTLPEGVEEVGLAAFYDCTYLNELTIPSTMKKIADNGFAGCEKMQTMYVNALVPPSIEAKTFEDVDRATPVFVPQGTLERYRADRYWSEFFNMAEYDAPSGNLNISADEANGLRKIVRDGQVLIIRGDEVYTVLGKTIQ